MKIAITGANGFVGSNLANHLHRKGHGVTAIVRARAETGLLDDAIAIRRVDYADPTNLYDTLGDSEVLIHNAGQVRTRTFEQMIAANVVTTRRVMEAANRSSSLKQFVYLSSQAASRPSRRDELISESDPSAPVTWYGQSKLLAERVIKAECQPAWTIIRPVPVYGEGDRDFLELFKLLKRGINFRIGFQDKQMNLIHSGQLCAFAELCLQNPNTFNQIIFASDGQIHTQAGFTALAAKLLGRPGFSLAIPVTLARLAFGAGELLDRATGKAGLINTQKMKEILAPNWICDPAKARTLLGWDPPAELEARLRSTLDWYQREGWL